jgi:hypothetical protein
MDWYAERCDGDWEHSHGIKLETLDNPGWRLRVDLEDTDYEDRTLERITRALESDISWLDCVVAEKQFRAACGIRDLPEVISILRAWIERS